MEPNLAQLINQSYINLETFRKNGTPVRTPVWFVQDGERLYVRTVNSSGKVKRIRNNPVVNIMPCGQRGEPLGEWMPARAIEKTDEASAELMRTLLISKYGLDMVAMFEARTRAAGLTYTVLLIEPGV